MAAALGAAPLRRPHSLDDISIKLRVSHLVQGADLEPNDLPPSAILIVRRMADPLPRGLSAGLSSLAAAPAWERAARSALSATARSAVRAAREAVPSNANAVLFADQAELLACFSRDYLRGEAAFLWWWRAILRSLPGTGARAIFEIWRQHVQYVPAVVTLLAERGEAAWIIRTLTAQQAITLLLEIARAFDLPHVLRVAAQPVGFDGSPSSTEDSALHAQAKCVPIPPPWSPTSATEELAAGLSREHAALLGVALALCQSPDLVRRPSFAATLKRWWRTASVAPMDESPSAQLQQEPPLALKANAAHRDAGEEGQASVLADVSSARLTSPEVQEAETTQRSIDDKTLDSQDKGSLTANSGEELEAFHTARFIGTHLPHDPTSGLAAQQQANKPRPQIVPDYAQKVNVEAEPPSLYVPPLEALPAAASAPKQPGLKLDLEASLRAGDCAVTELGGVFFLVTLLKVLGMPQLLEQASECELGLGNWECLELIARCLLGANRPDLASDPVWRLLAMLDGRPFEESPGQDFRSASSYRLPEAWLLQEGTSSKTVALRIRNNRLQIWSRLGFPLSVQLFDEPLSPLTLRHYAKSYAPTSFKQVPRRWSGVHPLGLSQAKPLHSFLAFLLPFVRWRLATSLGLKSETRPDFAEVLLSRNAKVWITATHVDVVMPLKQASTAVRFAGLDADPGWVPSFGRIVKFYFE